MENRGVQMQAVSCSHRESGKACPISKTPCLGECIYANILDDISLGIIGLDTIKQEVFFQNRLALDIFRSTIKPKDYSGLISLLAPDIQALLSSPDINEPKTLRYGNRFLGYSIYIISDVYLWIYVSDITEKVRLNAIAEAVNTMNNLGYIFSGIRHELGNPINSMKTTLAVCRKNFDSYSKEKIGEFIDRVLSDIGRVEVLLKDLKNFSMYENPECREVHMESFISNLLSIVERDFSMNNIKIKTFFRPDAEYGYFDPRALQQVLLNLLTNASDALQGTDSPEIWLSISKSDHSIVIRVKDNGRGVSEEQKKHLFQPFSTTKSHGTGLGLVIVKKMMFWMNGTVDMESTENVGTTVVLKLPSERPDAQS